MKSKCYESHLLDIHAPPAMKLILFNVATCFTSICSNHKSGQDKVLKLFSDGKITMVVATSTSRFDNITMAPTDQILGVYKEFKADTSEMKLNLGVGAYRTEELKPYVLKVVKKVNLVYGPYYYNITICVYESDIILVTHFVAENLMLKRGENKEVANIQGLSGTGSLRVAVALIERYLPGAKVPMSSPTWGAESTLCLATPEGSFKLLHGCAHNPTGIDPTL
ncbi:putative aspartate transaminase [Helianthus anomalus]